ncbi:MAG: methyltransferase domain-containing protein [Isosphaeraceae bacterium]
MITQGIKDVLFGLNRHLTKPGTLAAAARYRLGGVKEAEGLAVHLGCGGHYIPGMVNADGNLFRKVDLWLDLRNRLPFPDRSCRFVYSSHTIEHLFPYEAIALLREIRRVLAVGGVVRIAVPSVTHALWVAQGGQTEDWPRPFADPVAQAVNYLFCDGQHKYAYNFDILASFAREAGFGDARDLSPALGDFPSPKTYGGLTVGDREPVGSLVVELSA